MMPSTYHRELDDFVASYEELHEKFRDHENARAFLNEVAAELLSALERNERSLPYVQLRKYFLWLLGKKGFNARRFAWHDVDLPQHQCGHKTVINVSLNEFDCSADTRFAFDPRQEIMNSILVTQAVDELDEDDRQLLMARAVEGHTLREIASELGITPQGVKKRLDRVYSRIRRQLAEAVD